MARRPAVRRAKTMRARGEHGEAVGRGCIVGSGQRHSADLRRVRVRRRVRYRTEVPRNPAVSGRADLDESHFELRRRTCPQSPEVLLMLPLAGVTVVSLEQAVAAPFATRQLADL